MGSVWAIPSAVIKSENRKKSSIRNSIRLTLWERYEELDILENPMIDKDSDYSGIDKFENDEI
jgi:hypothetical protein